MNVGTNTLRGLVLAGNLILLGVVAWTSYMTFRHIELARWQITPPDLARFQPPTIQDDPLQREREVYNQIATVLEKKQPPPPEPPPTEPVAAAPTPRGGDPTQLLVVMMQVAPPGNSRLRSTVMLGLPGRPAGQEVEKPFLEGMALDRYPEFGTFKDVSVKSITAEMVVLTDASGAEVARLSFKKGGGK